MGGDNVQEAIREFQRREEARIAYKGHCKKISVGLEGLGENSGERAFWELIQNARDVGDGHTRVKIELHSDCLFFSHHGRPFDYTSLSSIVLQSSSKDSSEGGVVGQYGTGFVATHAFNRCVYVTAPFALKTDKDEPVGYVRIEDFKIDRTNVDTADGPIAMEEQMSIVRGLCERGRTDLMPTDDSTSFRYELTQGQLEVVSSQIDKVIRLLPFVLVLNRDICEVEIVDVYANRHIVFRQPQSREVSDICVGGWKHVTENVVVVDCGEPSVNNDLVCESLQSENGDIVIIPPFPEICGDVHTIPSLFLSFPLLGTEAFGVNFIFHSKRFHPVEKRDAILLPGSTDLKRAKGGANSAILKEMASTVLGYYADEANARHLPIDFCEVDFPKRHDDPETRQFYDDMQCLWASRMPDLCVLPIGDRRYRASDEAVRLPHPQFFERLDEGRPEAFEAVLYNCVSHGHLAPFPDLVAWAKVVYAWRCGRDREFFASVTDVCGEVTQKTEWLHSFLLLLKEGGNANMMEEFPILPNKDGRLRRKSELRHAKFLTSEMYELVKGAMGEDAQSLFDDSFSDVCDVAECSVAELQRAIADYMDKLRTSAVKGSESLPDGTVCDLLRLCSASCTDAFESQRGKLMPLLAQFYGKNFVVVRVQRFRDEDEEAFYRSPLGLLLDYTLKQISKKDSTWVGEHKEWLVSFLQAYSPQTNKEHAKRLDEYEVLPNKLGKLCFCKGLKVNKDVPEELTDIYVSIFGVENDLRSAWVDDGFGDIVPLGEQTAEEVAGRVEKELVEDMKRDAKDRRFEKVVRDVIQMLTTPDWRKWFPQIEEKKAVYTFSMMAGNVQNSLFALMDVDVSGLERLAWLSKESDICVLLEEMERQQRKKNDEEARFEHLLEIGKYVEDALREKIDSDVVAVKFPSSVSGGVSVEDEQCGQDIVIRVEDEPVFFIEVKSKWDFSEPAYMSTSQVRCAVSNSDRYALCCVYLGDCVAQDLRSLDKNVILERTKVKMDIGALLLPLMQGIMDADRSLDKETVTMSNYRCNIPKAVFLQGEPMQVLLAKVENAVRQRIVQNSCA